MPKRKTAKKAQKRKSSQQRGFEIVPGGIYTRYRIDGKVKDHFLADESEDRQSLLTKWLDVCEDYAIYRFGPRGTSEAEIEASRNESRQVLEVLKYINWMRDALSAEIDPNILFGAMQAGRAMEKLVAVRHEPDAAIGKRSKARTKTMRNKRTEKFSMSRLAIREECQRRLETNPGLKSKPTTLRDRLHGHFLKNGRQQKGYSKSAILGHIRDLCDAEK